MSTMSSTDSTHPPRAEGQYVVAIAGATGLLGKAIVDTLIASYSASFRVVALTRDTASPAAQALAARGVVVRAADYSSEAALRTVFEDTKTDVVVDALFATTSPISLPQAAVAAGVAVYFPAEFGSDQRLITGYLHPILQWKVENAAEIRRLAAAAGGKTKVISVNVGLFGEEGLNPYFGFDTAGGVFTPVGSADAQAAFTTKGDIARVLAELALLALHPGAAGAGGVPDDVRVAGSHAGHGQVARWTDAARARAAPGSAALIEVRTEALQAFVAALHAQVARGEETNLLTWVRLYIGEGKIDWRNEAGGHGNDNELVNPGESRWKWTTIKEVIDRQPFARVLTNYDRESGAIDRG